MPRLAVIPTLAALLLLGAGCAAAPSSAVNAPAMAVPEGATVVSMTASGFEPATISVAKGTTVYFKNADTKNHWVASAVHPVHSELPGFDAKRPVPPGEAYSFTFDQPGT